MKSWLYVGAKVVCVDDDKTIPGRWVAPVRGRTYTISAIRNDINRHGEVCIVAADESNCGFGWSAHRFRPVSTIDTKATVSALKQMMRDHVAGASGGLGIRKVRA